MLQDTLSIKHILYSIITNQSTNNDRYVEQIYIICLHVIHHHDYSLNCFKENDVGRHNIC